MPRLSTKVRAGEARRRTPEGRAPRTSRISRAALLALALLAGVASALGAAGATPDVEAPPERVLVAPLAVGPDVPDDPLLPALPAVIAEGVNGLPGASYTASLAHDLSPDTLGSLGVAKGALPGADALAAPAAAASLRDGDSIRLLLLPSVKAEAAGAGGTPGLRLTLAWRDLVSGKEGSASQAATGGGALLDAARRALGAARQGWSASWKGPAPAKSPAAPASLEVPSFQSLTSPVPEALSAWARASAAWNTGDAPGAESALGDALAADPNFALAKVSLAWIRFAQGRAAEARSLADDARRAKGRLSAAAREFADVIGAAAASDAAALEALRKKLGAAPAGRFPWRALAGALALILKGDHDPAVALLDGVRLNRPNDPAVLHQSGIAALGGSDPYEALSHLERAAPMWPRNDRIWLDLAEARVRNHDLDGGRAALEEMRKRFQPHDLPISGGAWSPENPPPPVRAVSVLILRGALSKAIAELQRESALLEEAQAPVPTRVAVLDALYELQLNLAFGEALVRNKWLNGAREAFLAMSDLTPPEEKESRPWVLLRREAILRVYEGRLPEARQIRERVLAASALPGYDPGVEAEMEAAIALKAAEMEKNLAACQRAVEVRGTLRDHLNLAQAHAIAARWKDVDAQVTLMMDRVETWSAARPRDAILSSTGTTLTVPFTYSLAGLAAYHLADADLARTRWGIFIAYFRDPDETLRPFFREATDTGAVPAW